MSNYGMILRSMTLLAFVSTTTFAADRTLKAGVYESIDGTQALVVTSDSSVMYGPCSTGAMVSQVVVGKQRHFVQSGFMTMNSGRPINTGDIVSRPMVRSIGGYFEGLDLGDSIFIRFYTDPDTAFSNPISRDNSVELRRVATTVANLARCY